MKLLQGFVSTSDKARKRFLGLDKREKWISAIVSNNISINYWGNQLQSTEVRSTKKCLLDFSGNLLKPSTTPWRFSSWRKRKEQKKKTLKFTQNAPSLDCFRYTQKHESLSNWKGKNCLENRSDQERQENWRHENFEKGRSRGKFQFSDAKFRDCDSMSSIHNYVGDVLMIRRVTQMTIAAGSLKFKAFIGPKYLTWPSSSPRRLLERNSHKNKSI